MKCKFVIAWVGECGIDAGPSGYCGEHRDEECCSCGKQATHECEETMGLVCGFPLCDDCEHTIRENGTNSGPVPPGLGGHCKKEEQVYDPWYMRET